MAQLPVICDFRHLQKVLLVALIVTIGNDSLSVHAISSEDPLCKREEGKRACTGENASVFSIMGSKNKMEDTFAMEEKCIEIPDVSLYGVFDGHGGDRAAKYTAQNLLVKMKTKLREIRKNIRKGNNADYTDNGVINYEKFLRDEIREFNDGELQEELKKNNDKSGTMAVIALITENTLYVANVGNSRAVLADINRNAIQITEDHKPNQKMEWKRIMASPDSRIVPDKGISRLFILETETNIERYMTVSRSLGDWLLRDEKYGFIADADIFVEKFSEKTSKFIILASNGLWNVVKNEMAVTAYLKEQNEEDVAKEVIRNEPVDDITIMVIKPSKGHEVDVGNYILLVLKTMQR